MCVGDTDTERTYFGDTELHDRRHGRTQLSLDLIACSAAGNMLSKESRWVQVRPAVGPEGSAFVVILGLVHSYEHATLEPMPRPSVPV